MDNMNNLSFTRKSQLEPKITRSKHGGGSFSMSGFQTYKSMTPALLPRNIAGCTKTREKKKRVEERDGRLNPVGQ